MSSPITSTMWMDEDELPPLSDFEPSLMTTAICPMSVFDKFGWDNDILGPDTDELLDKICIKTEPDELLDDKNNTDFGSLSSIFPDLIDDTKNSLDIDCLKSMLLPSKEESLSLFDDDSFSDAVIKEELFDESFKSLSIPMPVPVNQIKMENTMTTAAATPTTSTVTPTTVPVPVPLVPTPAPAPAVNEEKDTALTPITNSFIRIPVKRSPNSINANFTTKPGTTGRTVKAVVVCPDRSKSIVCNVVRSSNSKSIVIQKPVGRSLLNICGGGNVGSQRNEPKLPIKVNVITPKDPAFAKFRPAALTTVKSEPAEIKMEVPPTTTTATTTVANDIKIKMEYDEMRPETPQSLIGSDEEFFSFSSPSKGTVKNFDCQDNFIKSCLLDEDNLSSESYKCMPPAEVTGQIQPSIPDVFKYTPNSSPTNSDDNLDNFYSKLSPNTSQHQFYNKAAANVDHDYGFTCRTPKTNTVFCTDSLGIQTPSASEPPTDSDEEDDDDDVNLLSDSTLLNESECNEWDREQEEYFKQLQRQMQLAELVTKNREKDTSKVKSTVGSGVKERKNLARNRKRKLPYSKDRSNGDFSNHHHHNDTKIKISLTSAKNNDSSKFSSSAISTTGLLKVRLPAKDSSAQKRRKTSSGGRVFSPSERHLHNTNEQVRRIEMRQSFEELRRLIPKLYDKPRAPKVSILQEAKAYCDELFHNDCKQQSQIATLKCQQERLRTTLSQLRRCAAASRY